MSKKTKFKLTAQEGCSVHKGALATSASTSCEDCAETCRCCLTNLGKVHVFSVSGLGPQSYYFCVRKEDIRAIAFCVFTHYGQSFCLISPWEFERFSISWPGDTSSASYRLSESPKLSQA